MHDAHSPFTHHDDATEFASPEDLQRAVVVTLHVRGRGRAKGVELRSARSGRALFACQVGDSRGVELAVLCAERYCVDRGWVLVTPAANDNTRAAG